MPSALNNREWATVIWLAIGLIWMLTRADVRAMLGSLVRNLFQRKLFACLLMLAAYVVGLVLLGREIGLWTSDLIAATVVWFVASAMVLFLKSTRVSEETGFMRHTFRPPHTQKRHTRRSTRMRSSCSTS
jgi:hypothetical protein